MMNYNLTIEGEFSFHHKLFEGGKLDAGTLRRGEGSSTGKSALVVVDVVVGGGVVVVVVVGGGGGGVVLTFNFRCFASPSTISTGFWQFAISEGLSSIAIMMMMTTTMTQIVMMMMRRRMMIISMSK